MPFTPSHYQQAIFDWVKTGEGSALVVAVPGSGKTTTLVEALRHIQPSAHVWMCAFNKRIADTLRSRVRRPRTDVSTMHAHGYRVLNQHLKTTLEISSKKLRDLIDLTVSPEDAMAYGPGLRELVNRARDTGVGVLWPNELQGWLDLQESSGIEPDWVIPPNTPPHEYDAAIETARARFCEMGMAVLQESNLVAARMFEWTVDFGDELYLPILWDLTLPQYDWILLDEAQDTNPLQREWIRRSLAPGGRLLAVGDPRQGIYTWRGASHDAMEQIQRATRATTLPLSVCYRCATAIVEEAKAIEPTIEPAEGQIEGEVLKGYPLGRLKELPPGSAILCRNNAPLMRLAYQLIAQGIRVQVLGREIGQGLIKLIDRFRAARDSYDLRTKLAQYVQKERARLKALKQGEKIQAVEDQQTCLLVVVEALEQEAEGEVPVREVKRSIEELFSDSGETAQITCSTIHKAKGMEWPVVALARMDLIPSPWARTAAELREEENLKYVAITRAQERLLWLDDAPEKRERRKRWEGEEEEDA